jgi:protein TonB
MRAWTLGVSIAVHLGLIAGVVVAPLVATAELPTPPHATAYIQVTAAMPDNPPPVSRPRALAPPSASAAPLEAQDALTPEPPLVDTAPVAAVNAVEGGVNDGDHGGVLPGLGVGALPEPTPPPTPPSPPQPYRVGGNVHAPQKIRDVAPRYPAIAQASRVEGIVILEAVISEDGVVLDVRVLRSQPLLDAAAVEAVRQWRFTPATLNGAAVPVVMTVTVAFSLK